MPTIKRRFNRATVTLAPQVVSGHSALCGQTVDVLTSDGFRLVRFAGFLPTEKLTGDHIRVKIEGVISFNPGDYFLDEGTIWYCSRTVLLGAYSLTENAVYLVLDGGYPNAWCELK